MRRLRRDFGNAQRAFGGGEAAVVDDHREVIEIVEVLHGGSRE